MSDLIKMRQEDDPPRLGRELIEGNPEEFWHLKEAKILWYWVRPSMTRNGRPCYAMTALANRILRMETGYDFVIKVSEPLWADCEVRERRALILHELRHCGVKYDKDGSPVTIEGEKVSFREDGVPEEGIILKYTLVHHDLEIFRKDVQGGKCDLPALEDLPRQLEFDFDNQDIDAA